MISAHRVRPARLRAAAAAVALAILPGTARADMSWRIHDAGEVTASFTRANSSGLVFEDPGGNSWDLVTTIDDPAILNRGGGAFFALEASVVQAALRDLRAGTPSIGVVDIYLLPYPRRHLLDSSADDRGIYLSPGVYPGSPEQVHALVVHELGHVVHRRLLPDRDTAGWDAYRSLRGIEDASIYNDGAAHRNRPHEIFAEDFRALFGGDLANSTRSIENRDLSWPGDVPRLAEFFSGLSSPIGKNQERVEVSPCPSRRGQILTIRAGVAPAAAASALSRAVFLVIFDISGRPIRQIPSGTIIDDRIEFTWNGLDESDHPAAPGIYFAVIESASHRRVARVVITR